MTAIAQDLRLRIFKARGAGETTAEVAERFDVSPAFVRRLLQRHPQTGSLAAKAGPRGPKPRLVGQADRWRELNARLPRPHARRGARPPGPGGVGRHGVAGPGPPRAEFHKKSLRAAEQGRPDVHQARTDWPQVMAQKPARRLLFLDETWFTTSMARLFGYAPRGQRLVDALPAGHWKVTTFVGGLTRRGFIAPMVLAGAMDGAAFSAYVEQVLAKETRRGDLVILDNLSAHKTPAVRRTFERCRIKYLYLPPYSPDLNPIENAFAKLKRLVRSAAERTVEGLWRAIGRLIDQFSATACRNYFRHCGYHAAKT